LTPSGIELATYRLVAHWFNQPTNPRGEDSNCVRWYLHHGNWRPFISCQGTAANGWTWRL